MVRKGSKEMHCHVDMSICYALRNEIIIFLNGHSRFAFLVTCSLDVLLRRTRTSGGLVIVGSICGSRILWPWQ